MSALLHLSAAHSRLHGGGERPPQLRRLTRPDLCLLGVPHALGGDGLGVDPAVART